MLLLNRQGPGERRRRPSTQVVVNPVGHHFDRRRVLHFAAVLAAVIADQVGAVPTIDGVSPGAWSRLPTRFKGQIQRGSGKRERPLGHVLARWLLLFGTRRQLRNHAGVGIAAANFGLLVVPNI